MTVEQHILLTLMRAAIHQQKADLPAEYEQVDWQLVVAEARQQTVSLITLDAISTVREQIPTEVYQRWEQMAHAMLVSNSRTGYAQGELAKLLDKEDYPYVILKGEAAAAYYPKPELRELGDIDFLIDPAYKDTIGTKLKEIGFRSFQEDHACHVIFRNETAHLEMHFDIAGTPNGLPGDRVRAFMKDTVYQYRMRNNGQGVFKVPADHHHGMVLLLHMQHHMLGEGFGLRHLCDWACYVQATMDKPFWQDSLLPILKEIGLFTYAVAMTKTCAIYLGISCPDWAASVDEPLCEGIMEDILSGGNFGTKDTLRLQTGMMISNRGKDGTKHGKWYWSFRVLKKSVEQQHPAVKRWPVLYPFHFVYRLARYAIMAMRGKRASVSQLLPQINRRKSIYDQLHIFDMTE